ncbi:MULTISPECIES: fimbrial biogenesis chaperone [Providencia]|uniref:Pi-fimbriae chaperone protein n=1 Tax=Providencia heimbachae ATCC 35613 TaxID=1354272 RepID=A0A1B7JWU8_9GAMM|nr:MULTISPECIES: fimbria/pilus periplasmic chaperone [Providencia]MBP6123383.1 fimbria/pilus periplasmic chaperone [Providencia sp.]NIH24014.1 fimbria/pilus periplasmic chaperone [Providencia heimbachae]OAT52362.1 Pi-fimbriae chaperone protein [Providencia heimbachae ATCC 35613]QCJ71416.1 molecular chaperone [Providencia heimbachae]SQH14902.1 Chaperone protein papD precursor [Providencia heimbachae]
MVIRINQWVGLLVFMMSVSQSHAGISLDRTRLIITGDEASASANLSNTSSSIPFLAQAWVEDANGKKITSPLVVLPPLQRINGGQKGVARVSKTAEIDKLPQDKESLFYLNVREVPPKPDKPNVLQLAMQSRIKLFYRPTAIIPKSKSSVWQDQITFQKQGNNWRAENPTPYYVTIISLNDKLITEGGKKLTDFPGVMIAPKSNLDIKVNGASNSFTMMYVNDYGGHPELKYSCNGNSCKALPTEQQPR